MPAPDRPYRAGTKIDEALGSVETLCPAATPLLLPIARDERAREAAYMADRGRALAKAIPNRSSPNRSFSPAFAYKDMQRSRIRMNCGAERRLFGPGGDIRQRTSITFVSVSGSRSCLTRRDPARSQRSHTGSAHSHHRSSSARRDVGRHHRCSERDSRSHRQNLGSDQS